MSVLASVSRCRLRPVLTVLAVGLGVWLWGGSTARATCGDYLADHAGHGMMAGDELQADFAARESSGQMPCDGPECRRAPESPGMPVPVPPPTFQGERWACLNGPAAAPPKCAGRLVPDDDLLLPGGDPLALERPPRALRPVALAIEA